jgi:hypothetical protein
VLFGVDYFLVNSPKIVTNIQSIKWTGGNLFKVGEGVFIQLRILGVGSTTVVVRERP